MEFYAPFHKVQDYAEWEEIGKVRAFSRLHILLSVLMYTKRTFRVLIFSENHGGVIPLIMVQQPPSAQVHRLDRRANDRPQR